MACSHLATTNMAENWGLYPLFGEGRLVSIQHNVAWTKGYLHTKWHLDPCSHLVTIDMGLKLLGYAPFLGGGAGSPYNTLSLGLRLTSIASGILIHPAVWAQQAWAKNWVAVPHFWGGGLGQGLPPYQVAS